MIFPMATFAQPEIVADSETKIDTATLISVKDDAANTSAAAIDVVNATVAGISVQLTEDGENSGVFKDTFTLTSGDTNLSEKKINVATGAIKVEYQLADGSAVLEKNINVTANVSSTEIQVSGEIMQPDGSTKYIGKVSVNVWQDNINTDFSQNVKNNEDGTYSISGLADGLYKINAQPIEKVPYTGKVEEFTVTDGKVTSNSVINLTMLNAQAYGNVYYYTDMRNVSAENYMLKVTDSLKNPVYPYINCIDGWYCIAGQSLSNGNYSVFIEMNNAGDAYPQTTLPAITFSVGDGVTPTQQDLHVPDRLISGYAKTMEGTAVSGASIVVIEYDENGYSWWSEESSDANGRFCIKEYRLNKGKMYKITAIPPEEITDQAAGSVTFNWDGSTEPSEIQDIRLVEPQIWGKVFAGDMPFSDAYVKVVDSQNYNQKLITKVHSDGSYSVGGLDFSDGKTYQIFADPSNDSSYVSSEYSVLTASGANIDLNLRPAQIILTVKNSEDAYIYGGDYYYDMRSLSGQQVFSSRGYNEKVFFGGMQPGKYQLTLYPQGSNTVNQAASLPEIITINGDGTADKKNIELKLTKALITGTINVPVGYQNSPGVDIWKINTYRDSVYYGHATISGNNYNIGALPDGEYYLQAYVRVDGNPGMAWAPLQKISVANGSTTSTNINFNISGIQPLLGNRITYYQGNSELNFNIMNKRLIEDASKLKVEVYNLDDTLIKSFDGDRISQSNDYQEFYDQACYKVQVGEELNIKPGTYKLKVYYDGIQLDNCYPDSDVLSCRCWLDNSSYIVKSDESRGKVLTLKAFDQVNSGDAIQVVLRNGDEYLPINNTINSNSDITLTLPTEGVEKGYYSILIIKDGVVLGESCFTCGEPKITGINDMMDSEDVVLFSGDYIEFYKNTDSYIVITDKNGNEVQRSYFMLSEDWCPLGFSIKCLNAGVYNVKLICNDIEVGNWEMKVLPEVYPNPMYIDESSCSGTTVTFTCGSGITPIWQFGDIIRVSLQKDNSDERYEIAPEGVSVSADSITTTLPQMSQGKYYFNMSNNNGERVSSGELIIKGATQSKIHVIDGSGQSIPYAHVYLQRNNDGQENSDWHSFKTDGKGDAYIFGMGEGKYKVSVDSRQFEHIGYYNGDFIIRPDGSCNVPILTVKAQGMITVSGTISLPDGAKAPAGGIKVYPCIDQITHNSRLFTCNEFTIPEGESSTTYSLQVPKGLGISDYILGMWISNRDQNTPYIDGNMNTNGSFVFTDIGTPTFDDSKDFTRDVTLVKGKKISGAIKLPVAFSSDKKIVVAAINDNNTSDKSDDYVFKSTPITIISGDTSVNYKMYVPEGSYLVRYEAIDDLTSYEPKGYYKQNGMSYYKGEASSVNVTADTTIDLTLLDDIPVPQVSNIWGTSEWANYIELQGNDLKLYGDNGASVDIYRKGSNTPITHVNAIDYDDNYMRFVIDRSKFGVGDYSLKLNYKGAMDYSGDFKIYPAISQNIYTLVKPYAENTPLVYSYEGTGAAPWKTSDSVYISLYNEDIDKRIVLSGNSIAVSQSAISAILPGDLETGKYYINVIVNDKEIVYGELIVITSEKQQLKVAIKDDTGAAISNVGVVFENKDDPEGTVNINSNDKGEIIVSNFKEGRYSAGIYWNDSNGKYCDFYKENAFTIDGAGMADKQSLDLVVKRAVTISGTISLPNNEKAPAGGLNLSLGLVSKGNKELYSITNVVISEEQNSIKYSIKIPKGQGVNDYFVPLWINNRTLETPYLNGNVKTNGSFEPTEYYADTFGDVEDKTVNITLEKGKKIYGTISLPNGALSNDTEIYLTAVDDKGTVNGLDDIITGPKCIVPAGETSVDYSMFVPNGNYKIKYSIPSNLTKYESEGFYSASGMKPCYGQADVVPVTAAKQVNLSLIPGTNGAHITKVNNIPEKLGFVQVEGLNLTNTDNATAEIYKKDSNTAFMTLTEIKERSDGALRFTVDRNLLTWGDYDILVKNNGTEIYRGSFYVQPLYQSKVANYSTSSGTVQIEYIGPGQAPQLTKDSARICLDNYMGENSEAIDINSFNISGSTIAFELPSNLHRWYAVRLYKDNFMLSDTAGVNVVPSDEVQLSGKVVDNYNNNMAYPYMKIQVVNTETNEEYGFDVDKEGNYVIYNLPEGTYTINAYSAFVENCDGYNYREDIVIDQSGKCTNITQPKAHDLKMESYIKVSGKIVLPQGEKAPVGGLPLTVFCKYNDSKYETVHVDIPEGQNSVDYTIHVVRDPNVNDAVLGIWLDSQYTNYLTGVLGQSGMVFDDSDAIKFKLDEDLTNKNITPIKGNVLSGSITLPEGATSTGAITIDVFATDNRNTENESDDLIFGSKLEIAAGAKSVNYRFPLPTGNYYVAYKIDVYGCEPNGYLGPDGTVYDKYQASIININANKTVNLSIGLMSAPSVSSAIVDKSGETITLKLSKSIVSLGIQPSDFVVNVGGLEYDISAVETDEKGQQLIIKLKDYNIYSDHKDIKVSYSGSTITALDGMKLAAFSDKSVENQSMRTATISCNDKGKTVSTDVAVTVQCTGSAITTMPAIDIKDGDTVAATGTENVSYTFTESKVHNIQVLLSDRKGAITLSFEIDKIAPVAPIISTSPSAITNGNVTVTITYSNDSAIKKYKIENGNERDYTAPFNVAENTTVTAIASDALGNTTSSSISIINIDTSAPEVPTFEMMPNTLTNGAVTVTINFSQDSAVRKYKIGNGSEQTYTAPVVITSNTTITAIALDEAGNKSSASVAVNNIDNTAPTITVKPYNTSPTNKPVTVVIQINDNGIISEDSHRFDANGSFTFTAKDSVGNSTSKEVTISNIDTIPPTISISGCSDISNNANGITPVISWGDTTAVSRVTKLNGSNFDCNSSGIKAPGTYTLTATGKDEAGNTATATKTFTISWDMTVPLITVDNVANGAIFTGNVKPNITLVGGSNSTNYKFEAKLRDTNGHVINFNKDNVPTITTEGALTLQITATNPSYTDVISTKTISFTIDKTAPEVSIQGVDGTIFNTPVTPVITLSDNIASQFQLINAANITLKSGSKDVDYSIGDTISQDGNYTLEVTTTDMAGNASQKVSKSFSIDTTKPIITYSGVLDGYTYKDSAVTLKAECDEGATLAVTATSSKPDASIPNGVVNLDSNKQFTFNGKDGESVDYTVTMKAKDTAGNETIRIVSFTVDKLAVNIVVMGIREGQVINYNPDIYFTTYEGETEQDGTTATIDNTAFVGGRYTVEGSHVLTVKYVSAGSTFTKTINFKIDKTAPVTSGIEVWKNGQQTTGKVYVKAGDKIKVKASAVDTNAVGGVYFGLSGVASNIGMKNTADNIYEGEYTVENGNCVASLLVTAKDTSGNIASKTYGYSINIDNIKPVVSIITTPTTPDGANGVYKASNMSVYIGSTDVNDSLTYYENGVKKTATGSITISAQDGSYSYICYATDLAGNKSEAKVLSFEKASVKPTKPVLDSDTLAISGKTISTEYIDVSGQTSITSTGTVVIKKGNQIIATTSTDANGKFIFNAILLSEGTNTLSLYAIDKAGNESDATSFTCTLDSNGPIISVSKTSDTVYSVGVNEPVKSITAKFNDVDVNESNIVKKSESAYEITVSNVNVGSNTLRVSATDLVGNVGDGAFNSISIAANSFQDNIPVTENATVDVPSGTFNRAVSMLVQTLNVRGDVEYTAIGAPMSFEFTDTSGAAIAPSQPLVIKNYIGAGLTGVKLAHIKGDTITYLAVETTTSSQFDMDDETNISNLAEDKPIYITDTGYLVLKTRNFSAYLPVQDDVAPVVSITNPDLSINKSKIGTLRLVGTLTDTDNTSYVSKVTVDGIPLTISGTTGSAFSIDLSTLSDGEHTVAVYAKDSVGNEGNSSVKFIVDTTTPTVTAHSSATLTRSNAVDITVTTNEEATIIVNSKPAGTCNGTTSITVPLSEDTVNTINVSAIDKLGNTGVAAAISVECDTTKPNISISGVSDGNVYGAPVTITVNTTDKNFKYQTINLDGSVFTSGNTVSANGQHTLTVAATDNAGNTASTEVKFTIDSSVPTITLTGATQNEIVKTDKNITVTSNNADQLVVKKSVDGGASTTVTNTNATSAEIQINVPSGQQHSYTINATAQKIVGGVVKVANTTVNFTIDKKAPKLTNTTVSTTESDTISITGTVDEESDIYVNDVKMASHINGSFTIPGWVLSLGSNTTTVTAIDIIGNETQIVVTVVRNKVTTPETNVPITGGVILPPVITPEEPIKITGNTVESKAVLTDNVAVTTLLSADIKKAFVGAAKGQDGMQTVIINVAKVEKATDYSQVFQSDIFKAQNAKQRFVVNTSIASITIPTNMFSSRDIRNSTSAAISIGPANTSLFSADLMKLVGNRPVIEINAKINGKPFAWSNASAPVEITMSYKPTLEERKNPDNLVVCYIDGKGKLQVVQNAKFNVFTGKVSFKVTHFSTYGVAFITKNFSDLKGYKAAKKLEVMAARGIMNDSVGAKFNPTGKVTRAQFINYLVTALGLEGKVTSNYSDVKKTDAACNAIAIAKALGITSDLGKNTFKPNDFITRQDMVVFTTKALKLTNKSLKAATKNDLKSFTDSTKLSKDLIDPFATVIKNQILVLSGKTLSPKAVVTRAEVGELLYQVLKK